jgi:hypothetical protein
MESRSAAAGSTVVTPVRGQSPSSPHKIATALLLLLALAGCGVESTVGGSTQAPSARNIPVTATPTTSRPATVTPASTSSTGSRAGDGACPGGTASASSGGTPSLVFGPSASQHQGTAPGGSLVQIQLSTQLRWSPATAQSTGPSAQVLSPAGYFDPTLGDCVWEIRMPPSGTVTVTIIGSGSCTNIHGCPPFFLRDTFTITAQ